MTPQDYGKQIKFRSMLSKKLNDGVTAPCGRSVEHAAAVKCARIQMDKPDPDKTCLCCADALRSRGGGRKKGKKGAKRGR